MSSQRIYFVCVILTTFFHVATSITCQQQRDVEAAITTLIDDKAADDGHRPFIAGFVRLAFHDCTGGCDGCINMAIADNAGLNLYIEPLDSLYAGDVASVRTLMSRADLWALTGMVAAKLGARVPRGCGRGGPPNPPGQRGSCVYLAEEDVTSPSFTFRTGRIDCGSNSSTTKTNTLPDAHQGLAHDLSFFSSTFGFNARETVCIMGAHTLGEAHPQASGFRGPWVGGKSTLDNEFYQDLVEPNSNWEQNNVNTEADPRNQWTKNGAAQGGGLMLNTDIALFKDIVVDSDGLSNCTFDECRISSTSTVVDEFALNNTAWVDCFSGAFEKMLESGGNGEQLSSLGVCNDEGQSTVSTATGAQSTVSSGAPPSFQDLTCQQQRDVEAAITTLIDDNAANDGHRPFIAGFVRLAFHDCTGGCDGCINMGIADNAGLDVYIQPLDSLYANDVASVRTLMSRADLWALAGMVAAKLGARVPRGCGRGGPPNPPGQRGSCAYLAEADVTSPPVTFRTGRIDCGSTSSTTKTNTLPDAHQGLAHDLSFFSSTFGFTARETVCIMGAHTLGEAHPQASGFRGPWVGGKSTLDNEFYQDLVEPNSNWEQNNVNTEADPRNQWTKNGAAQGGGLMLNTDIALFKDIVVDSDGLSNCTFDECGTSSTSTVVDEFALDNTAWLNCFAGAFEKMLESGGNGEQLPSLAACSNAEQTTVSTAPGAQSTAAVADMTVPTTAGSEGDETDDSNGNSLSPSFLLFASAVGLLHAVG